MKTFLILLLGMPCLASGPKYVGSATDPLTYQEFQNVYQDIRNPSIAYGMAQLLTVSTITLVSSATIVNLNVTTINGAAYTVGGFQAAVTSTTITATTTTSSSFQLTTLGATITPTSSSHRIKIHVSGSIQNNNPSLSGAYVTIKRGSTNIAGTSGFADLQSSGGGLSVVVKCPVAFNTIDNPGTTSPVSYAVYVSNDNNSTTVGFNPDGVSAFMILEEVL